MSLFGTDGIRGPAGVGPLSPERVLALGRALGRLVADGHPALGPSEQPRVLVGRDSRTSGPMLGAALVSGLLAGGADVVAGGLLPTPAVAAGVAAGGYRAGVVISASHNPPADNGIKVLAADGSKASAALESAIESALDQPAEATRPGAFLEGLDPERDYVDRLAAEFAGRLRPGLRVVLDCARGAACRVGPALLRRLGAELIAVHDVADGSRINVGCGALAPLGIAPLVRAAEADLGICLDGDADRAILIDHRGERVDGDRVLALAALDRHDRGALPGDVVVGTVMTNLGLERALAERGIRLERAAVGDINVAASMRATGAVVGGEESGHLLFWDGGHPFGDGIHSALQVLEVMTRAGRPLAELVDVFSSYPQARRNLRVTSKPPLEAIDGLAEHVARVEADPGMRLVLRYSGTEALARVLVECADADAAEAEADRLAEAINRAIGAP